MLSFDEKKCSFKFKGEKYEVDYPTVKMINKFRKALKEGADEVDETIQLLVDLGAEKSVIESLRIPQLNALVTELTEELQAGKKN